MAKHAKPKDIAEGGDEYEPAVTISDDVAKKWRARRGLLKKREGAKFSTRAFGKRVGVSTGTVSNVERGLQKTLPRTIYAKWQRELYGESEIPEDSYDRLVKIFANLTEPQIKNLMALAKVIREADEEEVGKLIAVYQLTIRKPKDEG